MKTWVLTSLALCLLLFPPSGFSANEPTSTKLLERCWNSIRSLIGKGTEKPITPSLLERFVQEEAPDLGKLSEEEISLLQELSRLTGQSAEILHLLHEYSGPRERLSTLLKWNLNLLQAAQKEPNKLKLADWFPPEWEDVQSSWRRHEADGWVAKVDTSHLPTATTAALVRLEQKELAFRLGLSDEPLPLIAAEEVLHIDALATANANRARLETWVRQGLGAVVFEDLLSSLDQITRYDWVTKQLLAQEEKKFPAATIDKAIVFLIERDAMAKRLDLYRKLIEKHPEFKNRLWDEIAESKYPIAKMSGLLNRSPRFGLNPKFVEQLGEHLLDEIVMGLGGETTSARLSKPVLPDLKIPNEQEVIASTPAFFGNKPIEASAFHGQSMIKLAEKMKKEEIEAVRDYLYQPWMADGRRIRNQLGGGRTYGDRRSNLLDIPDNQKQALYMLERYDQLRGTNYAWPARLHLLRNLRPDPESHHNQYHVHSTIKAAENAALPRSEGQKSQDPNAIKEFVSAAADSMVWSEYLQDPNSPMVIGGLLQSAKKLAPENRPDPAALAVLIASAVELREAIARTSRDYNQYNERDFARKAAKAARAYFEHIGDKPRAAFFSAAETRLQEGMDRYVRDTSKK